MSGQWSRFEERDPPPAQRLDWRAILDQMPAAVLVVATPGEDLVFVNRLAEKLYGRPMAVGTSYRDFGGRGATHPDGRPYAPEEYPISRVVRTGRPIHNEPIVYRRSDGAILHLEASAVAIQNDTGAPRFVVIAYQDVTARNRAEAALRESEAKRGETHRRLNAILDNATVAIFLMGEDHHCAYMNAAAEKLTGFTLAEMRGRRLHDVIHHTRPDGSPYPIEQCPVDRALGSGVRIQGEEVFVDKSGRFFPAAYAGTPIVDPASKKHGMVLELRDVSQQKKDEAARALLMREVDHRSRNMLAVVQSVVAMTAAEDPAQFKEMVTGRLGALARAQTSLTESRWQGADLADLIRGVAAAGDEARLELRGPDVLVKPQHVQPLSMIVHELWTNAVKYGALSTPGGRLLVGWQVSPEGGLELGWVEQGGPGADLPTREGFGSKLMRRLARQLDGAIRFEWAPGGLRAQLTTS